MNEYSNLPTIEQVQEFLALINKGRAAMDAKPLEFLDFDKADPDDINNCLSARNLLHEAGFTVGTSTITAEAVNANLAVPAAIGAAKASWTRHQYVLPAAILAVTDPFDDESSGLRERLVEAGVVQA